MNETLVIALCLISLIIGIFIGRNSYSKNKLNSTIFYIILSFLLLLSAVFVLTEFNFFQNESVLAFTNTLTEVLKVSLVFTALLVLIYIFIGFLGKKYSLRVDNFNIGGINILFDQSNEIFVKSVQSYLDSKRSLENFKPKRDNISEVLDSYYKTYNYIRDNLGLLDEEKDEKLYNKSIEILENLNCFLTKHQNDYRRWFDKIKQNDVIKNNDEEIIVHQTTIEEVQKNYYRYNELITDFKKINQYFKNIDLYKILNN